MIITGKYIRQLRKEAGLSQAELAKLAKVSQAHIAKIENEKVDPRLSTVNRILFILRTKKSGNKTKCSEVMHKHVISVGPDDPVHKAIKIMHRMGISQMPVLHDGIQLGSIGETTIMRNFDRNIKRLRVRDVIDRPFPVVDMDDTIEILPGLLDLHGAVLVAEKGRIKGIITKSDLLAVK
ncbi:MAG: CBS domain-containing protein [Candidatus Aenigmarchaeota archaeon]|nr:CBS domain-containing protein [Candidatus Aenigmarchaeota archaeon]